MDLSRREREVAALVADGLTNRAIAKRLFLSERTVEGHVEHLLNKLGFDNRSQIASWFSREGGAAQAADSRLPQPLSTFIGRAAEAAALARLMARHRLVTLTGPAGIGKTRLALAAASSSPSVRRLRFAELSGAIEPGRVEQEVAAAIDGSGRDPEVVMAMYSARPTLLVLDNCEHVIDAAAEIAERLLRSSSVRILATSREPLRVEGEAIDRLGPMSAADAVALFEDRFVEARLSAKEVRLLVERLDCIPLAVELAAGRARLVQTSTLLVSIDSSLALLAGGRRSPHRMESLDRSVGWSYALLDAEEQRAFRALGAFAGSFTLDAAVAVSGADLEVLIRLVERSMIDRVSEDRYRLLYPMKEVARHGLEEAGEAASMFERHDRWVVAIVNELWPELSANSLEHHDLLWSERDAVWSALPRLEVGSPTDFARVAACMAVIGVFRLGAAAADELAQRALAACETSHPDRGYMEYAASFAAQWRGDRQAAATHARNGLALAEARHDPVGLANALVVLAMPGGAAEGDPITLLERGLGGLGNRAPGLRGNLLNIAAMEYWSRGDYLHGADLARKAVALRRSPAILDTLALNLLALGDRDEAETVERQAARRALQTGHVMVGYLLTFLADSALNRKDEGRAATLMAAARRNWEDNGRPNGERLIWDEPPNAAIVDAHPDETALGRDMTTQEALEFAAGPET